MAELQDNEKEIERLWRLGYATEIIASRTKLRPAYIEQVVALLEGRSLKTATLKSRRVA